MTLSAIIRCDPFTHLTTITCPHCSWSYTSPQKHESGNEGQDNRALHAEHEHHLATADGCLRRRQLVAHAAEAAEVFDEDELEAFAAKQWEGAGS